jgi:hypothetical protein
MFLPTQNSFPYFGLKTFQIQQFEGCLNMSGVEGTEFELFSHRFIEN